MKNPTDSQDYSPADDSLDALFALGRQSAPETSRAEFGFETRLLARMRGERADRLGLREITSWCWRLLPALTVLTLVCSVWTWRASATEVWPRDNASVQTLADGDSADFENWIASEGFPSD